ncbi:Rz1-like lysis system protein LysC [Zymobacter sp. IVIA_5232.4 C2]|uniref:Rz1-like lysis system protein LysC n=1 Tax=Zymobacter sp. IVIA_5232.4 C2 TaxID=3394855 RepID=UPI0039C230F8
MSLPACTNTAPSLAPPVTVTTCAIPEPCVLPAARPKANGDLRRQLDDTLEAWGLCAARVDRVIQCLGEAQR